MAAQSVSAAPLFGDVAFGLTAEVAFHSTGAAIKPVSLLTVLDSSGSMAGSQIEAAKGAIKSLYAGFLAQRSLAANVLISFNSNAETINLTGRTLSAIESKVDYIHAVGGTNFPAALAAIQKEVELSEQGSAFFIAFFSDGRDTSGISRGGYSYSYSYGYGYGEAGNPGNVLQQASPILSWSILAAQPLSCLSEQPAFTPAKHMPH